MGGTEATKLIASRSEEGKHARAKVVFCTAQVSDHFEQECTEAGAVGFLAKPCTLKGVDDCLRKVLQTGQRGNSADCDSKRRASDADVTYVARTDIL